MCSTAQNPQNAIHKIAVVLGSHTYRPRTSRQKAFYLAPWRATQFVPFHVSLPFPTLHLEDLHPTDVYSDTTSLAGYYFLDELSISPSTETRSTITRVLTIVDLQKAIDLIQRVKLLHRDSKWEASLEHYQTLRSMLADIETRHPSPTEAFLTTIREAIPQITIIEDNIDRQLREGVQQVDIGEFNADLNKVQEYLEEAASTIFFSENAAET